jgi:hypothetical protein
MVSQIFNLRISRGRQFLIAKIAIRSNFIASCLHFVTRMRNEVIHFVAKLSVTL